MRYHLIVAVLLATLFGVNQAGAADAKDEAKKDHPNLKITCDQYLDYDPEDLGRVYYWYDAYSWLTWDAPILEDDEDYIDWHTNLVTYCHDNKGKLVYDAIQEID